MANVRFYAVRLDLRWVLLVGALLVAFAVAFFTMRDSQGDRAPSVSPPLPSIGAGAPFVERGAHQEPGALAARPASPHRTAR